VDHLNEPVVANEEIELGLDFEPLHRRRPQANRFALTARTLKQPGGRAPGAVSRCALPQRRRSNARLPAFHRTGRSVRLAFKRRLPGLRRPNAAREPVVKFP
jgi:hypothetical protein